MIRDIFSFGPEAPPADSVGSVALPGLRTFWGLSGEGGRYISTQFTGIAVWFSVIDTYN